MTAARLNEGVGGMEPHPFWKLLWGRLVPTKVHIFNWRVLHGLVPCYCSLADRHTQTPIVCHVCRVDP